MCSHIKQLEFSDKQTCAENDGGAVVGMDQEAQEDSKDSHETCSEM